MTRLPQPGKDDGDWGDILNTFLQVEHNSDGTLRRGNDIDSALVAADSKYTLPGGGIPASDLASSIQTSLSKANSAPTALAQLQDVSVASPSDTQVLTYNAGSHLWTARTVISTPVSDATSGAKGIVQLSGDLGGNASTPLVKSRTVTRTVGPSGSVADFVCSGTADDVQINAAIAAVSSLGGGTVHITAGVYAISAHIILASNVTIRGEGTSTKLIMADARSFKSTAQNNIVIKGLYLDLNAHTGSNTYGMYIDQSNDITVDSCYILNCKNYGIFTTNSAVGTVASRFRYTNNHITGKCGNDLIGGGPGTATSDVTDILVQGNFVMQDATLSGAGTYLNALDIVSQKKTIISGNIFYGGCLLGGEKIPHLNATIANNVIMPPNGIASGLAVGQIAVLTASNASQTASSYNISIVGNQITSGNIYIQGQSSTASRTQKVIIANNNITGTNVATYNQHTYGINLNYLANVQLTGNIVDGSVYGVYLNNIQEISLSDNKILNCTSNLVTNSTITQMSGRNNLGMNPDVLYAGGIVTGAVTIDRINGKTQTFTLSGDINPTFNNALFPGDTLSLVITQDSTGGHAITWPANVKFSSSSAFYLSSTAGSVDVISFYWDGANWREHTRAFRAQQTIQTLADANNNPYLTVVSTASAVNYAKITNAATGSGVRFASAGSDTNVALIIASQAGGIITMRPGSNSADIVRIQNANGTTNILAADTQNNRLAIGGITPQSTLDIRGSISYSRTAVADVSYTILATDYIVAYTSLSASRTVILPLATSVPGRSYVIKDEANGAGSFNLIITPSGGQTIDGAASYAISVNNGAVAVYSDGGNWQIISKPPVVGGTATALVDSNGANALATVATASAVAYLQITNNVSGGAVTLANVGGSNSPTIFKGNGSGLMTMRPGSDSTDAVRIQNAAGTKNVYSADTTNTRLAVGGVTPLSTLDVRGSITYNRTTVSDVAYTVLATDYIIAYTTLTAARTVTLPTAIGVVGRLYIIKDEAGTAGTNNITLATTASQTIDGSASKVINNNYGTAKVYSNGTNWLSL
ncbi:MAG: beta strand repeat-containing protein [Candidatus Saccharibacteria bacterium]